MKHGVMNVLHGLLRSTDLRNCETILPTSSLSNLLILFSFNLLGPVFPRPLQHYNIPRTNKDKEHRISGLSMGSTLDESRSGQIREENKDRE
jgi:hypothetical protein